MFLIVLHNNWLRPNRIDIFRYPQKWRQVYRLLAKMGDRKTQRRDTECSVYEEDLLLDLRLCHRPLAVRGHVTSTSLKQWFGILLMTKIDRALKNYLASGIWEETHWFFNKVVWFVLAAMLEGILLPSNLAAKTTVYWYLVKSLIVTLRFLRLKFSEMQSSAFWTLKFSKCLDSVLNM